jgi:uncharacterized membrane protein
VRAPKARRGDDPAPTRSAYDRSAPADDDTCTSLHDLTSRNIETVIHLDEAERRRRNRVDVIADAITSFCGTVGFVWVHVAWFTAWIGWNVAPRVRHFDAFPFSFLTLVVSLEAIFLSTFILISQNRQSRIDDRRNHLDLQIDLLAEQENTKMIELLTRIAEKVGVSGARDSVVEALQQATHPDRLVEQIDRSMAASDAAEAEPHGGDEDRDPAAPQERSRRQAR